MVNNKDIVKYFYEVIVSESLLDELPKYIYQRIVCRRLEKICTSGYREVAESVKLGFTAGNSFWGGAQFFQGNHHGRIVRFSPPYEMADLKGRAFPCVEDYRNEGYCYRLKSCMDIHTRQEYPKELIQPKIKPENRTSTIEQLA